MTALNGVTFIDSRTMKRKIKLTALAMVAGLLAASCAKEAETPGNEVREDSITTFTATMEAAPDVKTTIGAAEADGSYVPKWTTYDIVRVNGELSSKTTVSSDAKTAAFTVAGVEAPYHAVSVGAVTSGSSSWNKEDNTYTVTVNGTGSAQQYRTGTYYPNSAIIASYGEGTALQFKHLMVYYKLTVTGTDIKNIKTVYVRQQGDDPNIAGTWKVGFTGSDITFAPDKRSAIIAYDCGTDGIAPGTPFILTLPAYHFKDGLIFTVKDVDGNFQSYAVGNTDFSALRGKIISRTLTFAPQSGTIQSAADWNAFAAAVNSEKDDWDLYRWVGNGTVLVKSFDAGDTPLTQVTTLRAGLTVQGAEGGATVTASATEPLFGAVYGTVKGLTLAGTLTTTSGAAVADVLYDGGRIEDCTNQMAITTGTTAVKEACCLAGIVRTVAGGTVSGCKNEGAITAKVDCSAQAVSTQVAGIIGQVLTDQAEVTIKDCTNSGAVTVTPTISGTTYDVLYGSLGGIVAWIKRDGDAVKAVTLEKCTNEGTLTWSADQATAPGRAIPKFIGGIIGLCAPVQLTGTMANGNGILTAPAAANGLLVSLTGCENKGTIHSCALTNAGSAQFDRRVNLGGLVGALLGQDGAYAEINGCTSTGTLTPYDVTGDGASDRATFATVQGGLVGWGGYVKIQDKTVVKCTMGTDKRQASTLAGAFGCAVRPFTISNSDIWFKGWFQRVNNFTISNCAIVAVCPKMTDQTPAVDIEGSTVTGCYLGGDLLVATTYPTYAAKEDLSVSYPTTTHIFNNSSNYGSYLVRGQGYTTNSGATFTSCRFWDGTTTTSH